MFAKRITVILLAVTMALFPLSIHVRAAEMEPDPARVAGITIHKLEVDGSKNLALAQDGTEINDPGSRTIYEGDSRTTLSDLKGLNGIGFTVTRVRDGTTSPNNTIAVTGAGSYQKTMTTGRVDGQDGIAVFENLPHGTYLVEETGSGSYKGETVKFLLPVPLPDPTGEGFIYDIHVYPKNTPERSGSFTKEVKSRTGNDVVWEFAWTIPDGIAGGKRLTLTEELDDRLTYKSAVVKYTNHSGSIRTLATRYYDLHYDRSSHTLTVTIDDGDGFAELAKALSPESGRKTPELRIEVSTTIKGNATGTIYNSGEIEYDDGSGSKPERPKRDPFVDTDSGAGGILIYKYDADMGIPLAGAEFQVYASRSDAVAGRNAISNPDRGGGSWGATGADGYLAIEGMEYEGKGTSYWIVETKAPVVDGKAYNLLPSPIEVKVGPSSHLKANRVEVANNTGITLPVPSDGDSESGGGAKVPDSGGMGGGWSALLGSALLAVAAVLAIRTFRKQR